jgi:enamine deaminase RidA (YjgF/YER057c/UK114 family)
MQPGEPVSAVFRRLADELSATKAELLGLIVFGALDHQGEIAAAMHAVLGDAQWPVTWVEGASCDGLPLAGVQAFAVGDRAVRRIRLHGKVVASLYEDGEAAHCILGGLGPVDTAADCAEQTRQTFFNFEAALALGGFEYSDVIRTWFYNDDILGWYGEFNRVRSAHYSDIDFRTGALPASTAVLGRNPDGAALAVAGWAVRPLRARPVACEVLSPLQCPAHAYGSSFSRAVELESGGARRLFVSGTASIFPDGRTAWIGDPKRQIELSMEVIEAILKSRGMSYADVTRASAYFKQPAFRFWFEQWLPGRGLDPAVVVPVHCDICRDDLLFEMELDAVVPSVPSA